MPPWRLHSKGGTFMLVLKERRAIKKIVKQYDCKDYYSNVAGTYEKVKKHDLDLLKNNTEFIFQRDVKVQSENAYYDLVKSHEKMRLYLESINKQSSIHINGKEVKHGSTWTFDHCFFEVTCNQLKKAIEIHEAIKSSYEKYNNNERLALLVLLCTVIHIATINTEQESLWSIIESTKEIKEAEAKYGEKFFVNDWLYDTFMHPELFESYGVYKTVSEANYSFNKANIIQDRL